MKLRDRRLIWDLESDGLLHQLTVIHVLTIRDIDTGETFIFRKNEEEDTILEGIEMLNRAALLIGHNIVGFDNYALWKVYGDKFSPTGDMRDTLIMSRMLFADIKERDFRLWKRGELDGGLIGSHTLEAWGMRLGFPKDDYSKRRKELAKHEWEEDGEDGPVHAEFGTLEAFTHWMTWGFWNQDMEDYGAQDLDPTQALWLKIERTEWSEEAIKLEHMICDLMARVEQNGFPFDMEKALILEEQLRTEHDEKAARAIEHFGKWLAPAKWSKERLPREECGEDNSREFWGEVTYPKRTMNFKEATKGDKVEGAPYCAIVLKEFNPNSRPMIIDRLKKIYGWEPQDFTEKNNPIVNDEVLRDLSAAKRGESGLPVIPIAEDLAEIFYYKKRLGQVADGSQSWIGSVRPDTGRIHARINPGGTVTNRASHSKPNIAQVPKVVAKKFPVFNEDGTPKLNEDGTPVMKGRVLRDREGDHGYNCRELFIVPDGWVLVGADQKGIELRALAHAMWEYDDGAYAKILLEGDVHDAHTQAMGLDSRDKSKTFIYAMLYGAQDFKLGTTIEPGLALYPARAKALGAQMRERLMSRFPALKMLVKSVQKSAKQGFVMGLDGRKLYVRAKHSALNTLLQAMGATLAKIWCVAFESFMEEAGFVHGWDGDFAILAWVHDEMQIAVRDDPEVIAAAERYLHESATYSGERVGFKLAVEVDTKIGRNWQQTH